MLYEDASEEEMFFAIDAHSNVILGDIAAAKREKVLNYCFENNRRIYILPTVQDIMLNLSLIHISLFSRGASCSAAFSSSAVSSSTVVWLSSCSNGATAVSYTHLELPGCAMLQKQQK